MCVHVRILVCVHAVCVPVRVYLCVFLCVCEHVCGPCNTDAFVSLLTRTKGLVTGLDLFIPFPCGLVAQSLLAERLDQGA